MAATSDDIGYLAYSAPSQFDRWHYHDEYELHLIVETHGKAYIGDSVESFEPGFLVLLGPGVPHNFISIDVPEGGVQVRSLGIHFQDHLLHRAIDLFPELRDISTLLAHAKHGVEFPGVGQAARVWFETIQSSTGLTRFAALAELLMYLARRPEYRRLSPVSWNDMSVLRTSPIHPIDRALQHIQVNYSDRLYLSDMSRLVNMSEYAFSRSFRRATGWNLSDFIARIRVAEASRLLRQTSKLVSDICYEVGFNNISHFNRQFRQLKGMTPTEYRRDEAFTAGASISPRPAKD